MRLHFVRIVAFGFLFVSCSKNGSSPGNANAGLLKNIIVVTQDANVNSHLAERFYFTYDAQNRLSGYVDSGATGNFYLECNFFYTGNSAIPDRYTMVSGSVFGGPFTEEHLLITNSKNQILEDSITSTNNSSGSGNSYYTYSDGLVTRTSGYYRASMNTVDKLGIDSLMIDANDNMVESTWGGNPTFALSVNTYQRYGKTKITHGNILSPFYQTPASLFSFIRGGFATKNCPITMEQFPDSSAVSNVQYSYQNNTDSRGVLQNVISNTGDTTFYNYY
jgi:hypothetical protein